MSSLSRMASQQNYDKQLSVDSKSTDEMFCSDSDADKEYKPHTEKRISKYRKNYSNTSDPNDTNVHNWLNNYCNERPTCKKENICRRLFISNHTTTNKDKSKDFVENVNTLDVSSNYNNCKQNIFETSVSDILNLVDVDAIVENNHRKLLKKQRISVSIVEDESNMNIEFSENVNILDVSSNYNNGKQNIFETSVSDIRAFIRALLRVNDKKPFKVLQLNENNFKNYHFTSKKIKVNLIPFNSVVQLQFSNTNINIVKYKTLHGVDDFLQINLCSNSTPNFIQSLKNINLAVSTKNNPKITKEKIHDVEYLYKFMPEDELMFYTNLFQRYNI